MKTATKVQFVRRLVLALPFALLPRPCDAQVTVVGPGAIPGPFEINGNNTYRIVPGTEIITTMPGSTIYVGNGGIAFWYGTAIFEGGHVEGLSITTSAGSASATAGPAISFGPAGPARGTADFHGGVFRGGSSTGNRRSAPAVAVSRQSTITLNIFGGVFEGGMSATPISRAPALAITNDYGATINIRGGEFVGGIELGRAAGFPVRNTALNFYGSDFTLTPPPTNGVYARMSTFTVSGKYADGTPFSTLVTTDMERDIKVSRTASALFFNVPEPTAWALALTCTALVTRLRRRRHASSPLEVSKALVVQFR